jgi:hypothetical protein
MMKFSNPPHQNNNGMAVNKKTEGLKTAHGCSTNTSKDASMFALSPNATLNPINVESKIVAPVINSPICLRFRFVSCVGSYFLTHEVRYPKRSWNKPNGQAQAQKSLPKMDPIIRKAARGIKGTIAIVNIRCKRKKAPSELENIDRGIFIGKTNQVAPKRKKVRFINKNITNWTKVRNTRSFVRFVFFLLCHAILIT